MSNVVSLRDVNLNRSGSPILKNVNWDIESDQRWVVIGPNGAGKTSLLRVAAAQLQPSSGVARVLGELLGAVDVFELRTRIGFASNALSNQIPNTERVLDAVMTASYGVTGRWREQYDEVDEKRAHRVLAEWRLSGYENRPLGTLSDGEKKRVQIARAVMTDPELLLLDEPVASLDLGQRETTLDLLSGFARSDFAPAMVMVTHHIEEIPAGFTHALLVKSGEVFSQGPVEQMITTTNVSDLFDVNVMVQRANERFILSR